MSLAWTKMSSSRISTLSIPDSIIKALDITDEVILFRQDIRINLHQCKRLVDFYKRARPYLEELQRSRILAGKHLYRDVVDALDDGRCLIAGCSEWNWMYTLRLKLNEDAFAKTHVKLEDSFRVICESIEAGVSENYHTHHEGLYLLLDFDSLAPLYFLADDYRATLFKRDEQIDREHLLEIIPGSSLDKYMIERIESMTITTDRFRAAVSREQGVVEEALLKNKEAKVVFIEKLVEGKKEAEGRLREIDVLDESERLRRQEVEERLSKMDLLYESERLRRQEVERRLSKIDLRYESERLRRQQVEQILKKTVEELLKNNKREKDALAALEKLQSKLKDEELKAAPSSSTGTDLLQNFKIQSSEIQIGDKIGSGGFATIHKCQWQNRDYALKMFTATDVEELPTEVQNLVLLPRHPNVVLLVGFCIQKTDGTPMLLMELLDGDLHTLLCEGELAVEKKKRRLTNMFPRFFGRGKSGLSTSIKIDFIYQIAKGMLFLHKRKVFHGDLKTKNVLVKQRPGESIQLKITDFGVSERLMLDSQTRNKGDSDEDFDCSSFSDHSSLGVREIIEEGNVQRVVDGNVGTTRWMAPEVYGISGTTEMKPFSMKADVYSFAMTCVEILTGQHPFPHIKYPRYVKQHVKRGGTPDLSRLKNDIPEGLLHLVKRCWHADPSRRPDFLEIYSSMQELKKAFPIK